MHHKRPINQWGRIEDRPALGLALVELLATIAIIALLVGLILAISARARASAKRAACSSNLRQMALAFEMYLADNDAPPIHAYLIRFPPPPRLLVWEEALSDYAPDQGIFICPSDPDQSPRAVRDLRNTITPSYECYGAVQRVVPADREHRIERRTQYYDAYLRDGIVFVCRHHSPPARPDRNILVAYHDASVKWEPVPDSVRNAGMADDSDEGNGRR